jgi:superfamily II helicase
MDYNIMRKEEVLKKYQEIVLALQNNGRKIMLDAELSKEFKDKVEAVEIAIRELNSCDACWFNDQYGKWFNKYIAPKHSKLINQIKMHGPEMKAKLREMGLKVE